MQTRFKKSMGMIVWAVAFIAMGITMVPQSVEASGSSGPAPSARIQRSPEQVEHDRLYSLGRKTFKKKVSCKKGCVIGKGIVKRNNAREYLIKINQETEFTSVLSAEEVRAVSIYLVRRYKIKA